MFTKNLSIFAVLIAVSFCAQAAPSASPKKSPLKPASAAQPLKDNTSYTNCRKEVVIKFKGKKAKPSELKDALEVCDERFPAIALFKDCKAQKLKEFKSDRTAVQNALKYCKLILDAATFDQKSSLPFSIIAGQFFYAGIGLNKPISSRDHELPNFNCEKITETFDDLAEPEYVLFGSEPRNFSALKNIERQNLLALLRGKKSAGNDPFYDVPGFGRLYVKDQAVFFPVTSCSFSTNPGKYFEDHKLYYLIDFKTKELTPYFGISFFKKSQKEVTSQALAQEVAKKLGPKFKVNAHNKRSFVISEDAITAFDSEGDPKNICAAPRSHRRIGIIKNDAINPTRPEYLIVANIKNVCDFGDVLAGRLALK
jgi:hypothetical protein